ncbi:LysE family transporter [Pseudokineococcus basanitobsidens]|uniref:LysE family transporter n=1 Tax=Pseudokineococcus basanitobsidens TaxID=1926649 RepID=A0ABU8RFD8_9ACTN
MDLPALLAGLGLGLSLIVAIGAQNAFVLRQGLRGKHVGAVVALCTASDVVLVAAGVGGVGGLVQQAPWALVAVRVAGAFFLLGYAGHALARALRSADEALLPSRAPERGTLAGALGTAAALTWLNPHVYLDTVVLLGSLSGTHGDGRWWFGAGAALASALWFTALGHGARFLRPLFARPGAWRVLDGLIAVVMVVLALSLVVGLGR